VEVLIAGTVVVLLTAAAFDVRHGKIPNILLITLLFFQSTSELISLLFFKEPIYTWTEVFYKLFYSVLIVLFLYPFFLMSKLGAGDIKLIAVVSLSLRNVLTFVFLIFAIGGCISLEKLLLKKKAENGRVVVHLAVPIFLAYCLAVYFEVRKG